MRSMRVLIAGSGAVGGYFGVKLALAGHDVTFLARGEHGRAIRDDGLHVETPDGVLVGRGRVVERLEDVAPGTSEVALVAVKTPALDALGPGVARALVADGAAVPLQNGLDSEDVLAAHVGEGRTIGGIARMGSAVVGPGRVRLVGGGTIVLAPYRGGDLARVEALAKTLSDAGIDTEAKPDLGKVLWGKLLWNGPFNGICALTRLVPGEVLKEPSLEALVRGAMHEILAVARADGAPLPEALVDAMIDGSRTVWATTEPSMLQDVLAAREHEVESLQAAVVSRGRKHAVPTPIHDALTALLRGLQPR